MASFPWSLFMPDQQNSGAQATGLNLDEASRT
jgi:hypothetical protein